MAFSASMSGEVAILVVLVMAAGVAAISASTVAVVADSHVESAA